MNSNKKSIFLQFYQFIYDYFSKLCIYKLSITIFFYIYIYIKFHKISSLLIIIFYLSMKDNDSIKNAGLSLSILFSLIINI